MDPTAIVVALVGALALVATSLISSAGNRKTQAAVSQVAADVSTNHGRTPGQHLEMMPLVLEKLDTIDHRVKQFNVLLVDHIAEDEILARRFADQMARLEGTVRELT